MVALHRDGTEHALAWKGHFRGGASLATVQT